MKFKLTTNIKDGYREITYFKSGDGVKSFAAVHVFKYAEAIVNAKSKADLLKNIEKHKQKSKMSHQNQCINLNVLDFSNIQDSNSKGVLYFDLKNVANDGEAEELEHSGEMLDTDNILELDLPINIENLQE